MRCCTSDYDPYQSTLEDYYLQSEHLTVVEKEKYLTFLPWKEIKKLVLSLFCMEQVLRGLEDNREEVDDFICYIQHESNRFITNCKKVV